MRFTVTGHPRTKKTGQRIVGGAGGRMRIIPSKVTIKWSNDAQLQIQAQLGKYRGQAGAWNAGLKLAKVNGRLLRRLRKSRAR